MEKTNEIIKYLMKNRVSTTEVADALGKSGVLNGVQPISEGFYRVGKVRCIFTANNSNYDVHEQIKSIQPGDVPIIFTHNCEDRAIIGDLIAKFVLLYKEASAFVIDGMVRDVAALRRENFAVWSKGFSPLGCFNQVADPMPEEKQKDLLKRYEGGVAVCDDGGVVIIPPDKADQAMLERLHRIEMQEDIWFFCLDTLKWDTKKIVCDKDYLKDTSLLSSVHLKQLEELGKPLDKNINSK